MMWRVIVPFFDLKDAGRPYNPGDAYPHDGKKVAESRIAELAGSKNRIGRPLIEEVKDEQSVDLENAESKFRKAKQRKR